MSNFIVKPDGTIEPMPEDKMIDPIAAAKAVLEWAVGPAKRMQLGVGIQIPPYVVPTTGIRANTLGKLKSDYPHLLMKHCANPNDPSDAEFMAMAGELETLCAELKLNAEYLRQLTERSPPIVLTEETIAQRQAENEELLWRARTFQVEDRIHRVPKPVVVNIEDVEAMALNNPKNKRLQWETMAFIANYGGPGTGWTPELEEQSRDRLDRINAEFKKVYVDIENTSRMQTCIHCGDKFIYRVGPIIVACPTCTCHQEAR